MNREELTDNGPEVGPCGGRRNGLGRVCMSEEVFRCAAMASYSLPYIREDRVIIFSLIDAFPTGCKVSIWAAASKAQLLTTRWR